MPAETTFPHRRAQLSPVPRGLARGRRDVRGGPGARFGGATSASARRTRTGLILVSPALLFVGAFALFPLGFGVYISLTNWPLIGAYHFVGFANYIDLV